MPEQYDVLIVGGGPVGLFGAYYAGVRGLKVAVIDSLSQLGGQVTAMYPEKQIYDIAGFPHVSGRELVANLVAQAGQYEPAYMLGEEAQDIALGDGAPHVITTSSGRQIHAGSVIVTGGIGTFTPRPLPAGEDFLGRGLEYFVPSIAPYAGQDVVIVGGGDSAIDWCLMLAPVAASVTLVHRREQFRAHAASLEQVRSSDTRIIINAQVASLHGEATLQRAVLDVKGEDPQELDCQQVVAALGFTANLGPLREWGLELHDNRHLVVDSAMRTNLPGVFAAGDITDYEGKVRLIAVGFGEVATAVNNAAVYLDPDAQLFPGHSTDTPHEVAPVPAGAVAG
ncbi:FAD-dependent oxidoreductase [Epidermidibacterium keratini]|uniref:Ferredoxin--NADP reductase n=1 Tax=Epidermidibacterium keratini TaxID=1891644 RepID=A0A7L4YN31_9ACTN|nr:NAD(P)/FAD-dependent oxidoreductase [Epidermidibacterium keratini]QHC00293.1 FAD-dependent oxidoreductase [Epidermidibacterium keratini]